jgi:hypothetical protein
MGYYAKQSESRRAHRFTDLEHSGVERVQLSDLQITVDQWIRRNDDYWDQFQILARLTEEVGEIALFSSGGRDYAPARLKSTWKVKWAIYFSHWMPSPM